MLCPIDFLTTVVDVRGHSWSIQNVSVNDITTGLRDSDDNSLILVPDDTNFVSEWDCNGEPNGYWKKY